MTTPTGILFYDPQAKPLSATGQFQAGCYLYFYTTGTTNQTNVYADGGLTTPITQPVTADSAGRFVPIYLDPSVIYRVQLYNVTGTKLEDTDPYVVLPIPTAIATLITDVATNTTNIATLTTDVGTLQSAVAWDTLTGVPAPLTSLGDSSPPDTGLTFWRDDGTWAAPSVVGGTVTQSIAADVTGIGSTFTNVIASIPVTAGGTYAMYSEFDVRVTSAGNGFSTVMTPNAGTLTGVSGALSMIQYSGQGQNAGNFAILSNTTDFGNAAIPGLSDHTDLSAAYNNDLILRGKFTVGAGITSVSMQFKIASGAITTKAGGFITLTRIA